MTDYPLHENRPITWLKRQAKRLKKERGVTHHEALDMLARKMGFVSWQDFLQEKGLKDEQST